MLSVFNCFVLAPRIIRLSCLLLFLLTSIGDPTMAASIALAPG